MVRLRVLSRYANRGVSYVPGQVIEVSEEDALYLVSDSPASFEVVDKALDRPPVDRAVRRAPRRK